MDFDDHYDNDDNNETTGDNEFDGLLVTRLPVSDFDDYDPNTTPNCGEDYLRRVQIEAEKCAEVVVADMDLNKFKTNQTVIIDDSNNFQRAKPELMASIEWQRKQVADFTKIRLKLCQMKAYLETMGDKTKTSYRRNNSESFWKDYCLGNSGTDDEDDDSSSDDEPISESDLSTVASTPHCSSESSTLSGVKRVKSRKGNLPLLSTICDVPQHEVIQLLNYHIKWIRQLGFKDENALWIYALLAVLDKPLPSEVYSTLRQLSRVCSEIRAKITSPTDSIVLTPLNLIICLIGRYFDQNDMIDE